MLSYRIWIYGRNKAYYMFLQKQNHWKVSSFAPLCPVISWKLFVLKDLNLHGAKTSWNLRALKYLTLYLFRDGGPYHIETSPLIYHTNQWTCFNMIETYVIKELMPSGNNRSYILKTKPAAKSCKFV